MECAALDFGKCFCEDGSKDFVALRTADLAAAFADFCGGPGTLRTDGDGIRRAVFRFFVDEFIQFFRIEKYFG